MSLPKCNIQSEKKATKKHRFYEGFPFSFFFCCQFHCFLRKTQPVQGICLVRAVPMLSVKRAWLSGAGAFPVDAHQDERCHSGDGCAISSQVSVPPLSMPRSFAPRKFNRSLVAELTCGAYNGRRSQTGTDEKEKELTIVMKLKKRICAAVLALSIAVCATSIGLASWSTTVSAVGGVSAAGSWDVSVSDAGIRLSQGASLANAVSYGFEKTTEAVSYAYKYVGALSSNDSINASTEENHATQSEYPMQTAAAFYAIDTSKTCWSEVASWNADADQIKALIADETTVDLSDYLNAYYRYNKMPGETSKEIYQDVVDAFIADTLALLQELFPETWMHYDIVTMVANGPSLTYEIATMEATVTEAETVVDGDSVTFAGVNFALPGAWAEYSLTVTNNGTVDANLSGAVIALDTTDSEQLVLDAPDLSDETLAPGESCTITVVVKVPTDYTGDLDASGTLTITLPYSQTVVEDAPSASHTH